MITSISDDLLIQYDCDAIVNSAHPSMLAGSGVCGAIHKAAGKELEEYGKRFAPLVTNQAVITPAFKLPFKHIIHVSAPRHHQTDNPIPDLQQSIVNVLLLAKEHGIKKIAFPAIGTGVYGYSMEEAVIAYVNGASPFVDDFNEIRFVFVSPADKSFFDSYLSKVIHCIHSAQI